MRRRRVVHEDRLWLCFVLFLPLITSLISLPRVVTSEHLLFPLSHTHTNTRTHYTLSTAFDLTFSFPRTSLAAIWRTGPQGAVSFLLLHHWSLVVFADWAHVLHSSAAQDLLSLRKNLFPLNH